MACGVGGRGEELGLKPMATGFMTTPRTFGQQFLFTRCWSSRHRPGTPRSRRVGRALLGTAAPAIARLPKKLGVVNLGNDVGSGEPEVTSK